MNFEIFNYKQLILYKYFALFFMKTIIWTEGPLREAGTENHQNLDFSIFLMNFHNFDEYLYKYY